MFNTCVEINTEDLSLNSVRSLANNVDASLLPFVEEAFDYVGGQPYLLQAIFKRTTFPEMKLNWQTHPNNLGHFYFSGCFRCHDGQHVSADGRIISKDCNQCHTMLSQTEGATPAGIATAANQGFQHPVDIGDLTQVNCADCHTGGVGP